MKAIEKLRRHFLYNQRCNPSGSITYQKIQLAAQFKLPVDHVMQVLDEMAREGLIAVAPIPTGAHVEVTVTARGAELIEEIPASSIGFNPK
jgi:hypothetical protein